MRKTSMVLGLIGGIFVLRRAPAAAPGKKGKEAELLRPYLHTPNIPIGHII